MVLDRHDANAGLIDRVFKDSEATTLFAAIARKIVYWLARAASSGRTSVAGWPGSGRRVAKRPPRVPPRSHPKPPASGAP